MRKRLSLAYIAGFFDGEGSIGIYRNGAGTFYLRVQLTQNINPESTQVLDEFSRRFGGKLNLMRSSLYRHNAAYNWQINGKRAEAFLRRITPWLILKAAQAKVAVKWQTQHKHPGRNTLGQMNAGPKNAPVDLKAARTLKQLKRA